MRKLFISALSMLAVAMGFTACSSDDDFVSNPDQSGRIRAYATTEQASATRTELNGDDTDGYQVFWSADDEITIGGKVFTLDEGVGTSTGAFKLKTGEDNPVDGTDVIAYYPSTYDGTNWPTTQTYVAGNIPQGVPMKATGIIVEYGEGPMISLISFKNVGGILRLNLKGTAKVTSIKISATDLEPITLDCGSTGVQLNEETATPFHIAVPGNDDPGTAYSGLKIEITDDAGKVCTKTLKSDKTITVQRSMITDISLTAKFPPAGSIGTAIATISSVETPVKWVQLWEGGPKFAEYNVGAANNEAEDYGGYYNWGMSEVQTSSNSKNYKSGTDPLTGADDTATKLWGSNWRMPTQTELKGLIDNCDVAWTNVNGMDGCKFTGKGAYASNSVFLPAAGYCDSGKDLYGQGYSGNYWSSTPEGNSNAYYLRFVSDEQSMDYDDRRYGYSVRPVLDETPKTTGTAEVKESAGITGNKVNWVQLWDGGPKFAEYNVGASSATEVGSMMTFTEATKAGAEYVWGANWCTPSKADMEHLMTAAKGEIDEKVECKYTQENGKWGFKFTGKDPGYTSNSVFFPAFNYSNSSEGYTGYWSATPDGSNAWVMYPYYLDEDLSNSQWYSDEQNTKYLVRPVLKN